MLLGSSSGRTTADADHSPLTWRLQVLEIAIKDSRITGRSSVGLVQVPLRSLPEGGRLNAWLPVVGNHARGGVSPALPTRPATVLPSSRGQQDPGRSATGLSNTPALPTASLLSGSCIVCSEFLRGCTTLTSRSRS